ELSFGRLRARQAQRQAWILVQIQSILIFLLFLAMTEEYAHNQFFQAWVALHFGGLGFLLNGSLTAFYAGLMISYHLSSPRPRRLGRPMIIEEERPVMPDSRQTS